ncbi:histone deacetylase 8-like isoform X2 [Epargyreus clarus]|uniref:histone deacetylase 8-like isoform X2 n=1 Tax=Epargyreus clarus TaxID=520877 RepID=UPI003C2C5FEF
MNKLKVCYIWDENLIQHCDRLPAVVGRASMVHNLITVYGLLKNVQVVRSSPATYNDLKSFHSELYLDHLKKLTDVDDDYIPDSQDEEYVYDCPPVSDMYQLVTTIAGGSITAAKCLLLGIADVAINWCGGWHHAQRFGAEGFCYVNDIVLAIEKLRQKFPKVLYIDLDVHHGNGVQDAYNLSKSVFTLSFHKHEPGFYPGTGSIEDTGSLSGKGYSCNFPLKSGYSDTTLQYVFEKTFPMIYSKFLPDAIVVQCGADALAHDPHGGASMTTDGYCKCLKHVLDKRKPTILLGGGGYKHTNAARLWTTLLALVTGDELDENIPEHDQWPSYGPDYSLVVEPTLAKDTNSKEYLDKYIAIIESNLNCIKGEFNNEPLIKRQKMEDKKYFSSESDTTKVNTNDTKHNEEMKRSEKDGFAENCSLLGQRMFRGSYSKCIETPQLEDLKDVYEFVD